MEMSAGTIQSDIHSASSVATSSTPTLQGGAKQYNSNVYAVYNSFQ
jgi:hypothetical protein